jgi:hypothetical protein
MVVETTLMGTPGSAPGDAHHVVRISDHGLDEIRTDWSFSVALTADDDRDHPPVDDGDVRCSPSTESEHLPSLTVKVPERYQQDFEADGFVVFPSVLRPSDVELLNRRLDDVLQGNSDRGREPDKIMPKDHAARGVSARGAKGGLSSERGKPRSHSVVSPSKVIQIINIHKADSVFRRLACDAALGRVVAQLAGWESVGARLAQDQVWAKPPGAPPLVFHRDSPYFMFEPPDVVTVWVALDDMDRAVGPLEYVRSSHRWGEGRVGTANQFFQADYRTLLESAAARQGVHRVEVVSMAGLPRGSLSIHNGRTWHGSGRNQTSDRPRRGLGLHFVPANVRFTKEASKSRLWRSFVIGREEDPEKIELSEEDFPLAWRNVGST